MTRDTVTTISVLALGYTLTWLLRALDPWRRTGETGINRFSWATLTNTSASTLLDHVVSSDVRIDAWRQVIDLSVIASEKFDAFHRALIGSAIFAVSAVVLVGVGIALVP